jgi:hypothetical protein
VKRDGKIRARKRIRRKEKRERDGKHRLEEGQTLAQ